MPLVESVRRAGRRVGGSRAALGRRACPGNVACLRPAARGGLRQSPMRGPPPPVTCMACGFVLPSRARRGCTHVRREAGAVSGLLTRWLAIAKFFRASLPGGRRGHRRCLSLFSRTGSRPGSSQARAALVHGSNFRNPGRCVSRRLARPGGAGGRAAPQLPFALSGSVIVACFSAYALYGILPDRELAPWIAVMLLVAALRCAAMLAYDRHQARPDAAERWLRRMFLGNLASGMLWGHRSPTGVSSCPSSTSCSAS